MSTDASKSDAAPVAATTATTETAAAATDTAATATTEPKAEEVVPVEDENEDTQMGAEYKDEEEKAAAPVALGEDAYFAMAMGVGVSKADAEKAAKEAVQMGVDPTAFLAGVRELAKQNKPRGSKPVPAATPKSTASSVRSAPRMEQGDAIPGAVFFNRSGGLYTAAHELSAREGGLNNFLALRKAINASRK